MVERPEAAGRPALAATLAGDWGKVLDVLDDLPNKARTLGTDAAVRWGQIALAEALDLVDLAEPDTPEQIVRVAGLRLGLSEWAMRVGCRADYRGERYRALWRNAAEEITLRRTIRVVFRASRAAGIVEEPYKPEVESP